MKNIYISTDELLSKRLEQTVNIPRLATEINECFTKLLPNPLLINMAPGVADTIDDGLAKIRDNLLALIKSMNEAKKDAIVLVDKLLNWHDVGCIKRYGAVSEEMCECEKRRAAASNVDVKSHME